MYCPECGAEYRDGVTRCHDCEVELVSHRPVTGSRRAPTAAHAARRGDQPVLVPAFRTTDPGLLPVIKSLLDSAEIPFFVQGEEAMGLFPLGAFGGHPSRARLAAVVHVPPDRVDEVRELLGESLPGDEAAVRLTPDAAIEE